MTTKETVKKFLLRSFRRDEIGDDENFFEGGIANSLFSMQLIMFIEKEFDITVENDDMDIDNFTTLNKITEFIESKKEK